MAVFMEKHTPKSSANSSLPASQSPNDETARTRPGAKGKGPSLNDARCANTRTRESVRVLTVEMRTATMPCAARIYCANSPSSSTLGYAWANRMKRLLLGACHQVERERVQGAAKRYRTILERASTHPSKTASAAQVRRPQSELRDRRAALRRLHQQSCRATCAWPRSSRKLRMLPHPQVRRSLLPISAAWRIRATTRAIQIALAGRAVDNMGEECLQKIDIVQRINVRRIAKNAEQEFPPQSAHCRQSSHDGHQ